MENFWQRLEENFSRVVKTVFCSKLASEGTNWHIFFRKKYSFINSLGFSAQSLGTTCNSCFGIVVNIDICVSRGTFWRNFYTITTQNDMFFCLVTKTFRPFYQKQSAGFSKLFFTCPGKIFEEACSWKQFYFSDYFRNSRNSFSDF